MLSWDHTARGGVNGTDLTDPRRLGKILLPHPAIHGIEVFGNARHLGLVLICGRAAEAQFLAEVDRRAHRSQWSVDDVGTSTQMRMCQFLRRHVAFDVLSASLLLGLATDEFEEAHWDVFIFASDWRERYDVHTAKMWYVDLEHMDNVLSHAQPVI